MKTPVLLIILNALAIAWCYPTSVRNYDSCLVMTEERQKQINYIQNRISKFLFELETEFEDIDLTNVKVNVEKHTDGEPEKDSAIIITVNDCTNKNKKSDNDDKNAEETKDKSSDNTQEEVNSNESCNDEEQNEVNDCGSIDFEELPTDCDSGGQVSSEIGEEDCDSSLEDFDDATAIDNDNCEPVAQDDDCDGVKGQPEMRRQKSPPQITVIQLNKEELRRVEEMEKRTVNKPFVLIEQPNGQRDIRFIY